MKNRKLKILRQVLKNSTIYKLLIGYIIFFLITALLTLIFEPSLKTYGDSAWYCFVACVTIGFGDFAATTVIGRLLTVILYIYTVIMIALVTAVITQYFLEVSKAKQDESVSLFLNDLENLDKLPTKRLKEISEKVKNLRNK